MKSFEEAINLPEEHKPLYGSRDISLKFLVDAQLPEKLSELLAGNGFIAIHSLDLPGKNATTDNFLKEKAFKENYVLITKDDDFLHSFVVEKKPPMLILGKNGNIADR